MHTYIIYWMNGKASKVTGHNLKEAFNRATIKNPHSITDIYKFKEVN